MADVENKIEFEPGSEFLAENGDHQAQAIVSAAISLKRIADALTYQAGDSAFNLFDHIREIATKP